ncbi:MAG: DUF3127 domain-containing protein [Bacteroidales bacterium]|nr:DUF3127 domain-containing protein [Bacteroidales bacterium]
MANLEIEGRLVRKLAVQSGRSARGDWSKQEFVVEFQDGNFPSNVVFNVWGADKVRDLERYQVGDEIRVSFAPSSREFNGRWYTDLRAWRIAPAGQAAQPAPQQAYGPQPAAPRGSQDVPAGFAPRSEGAVPPAAPAPTFEDMPGTDSGDDLPF